MLRTVACFQLMTNLTRTHDCSAWRCRPSHARTAAPIPAPSAARSCSSTGTMKAPRSSAASVQLSRHLAICFLSVSGDGSAPLCFNLECCEGPPGSAAPSVAFCFPSPLLIFSFQLLTFLFLLSAESKLHCLAGVTDAQIAKPCLIKLSNLACTQSDRFLQHS